MTKLILSNKDAPSYSGSTATIYNLQFLFVFIDNSGTNWRNFHYIDYDAWCSDYSGTSLIKPVNI